MVRAVPKALFRVGAALWQVPWSQMSCCWQAAALLLLALVHWCRGGSTIWWLCPAATPHHCHHQVQLGHETIVVMETPVDVFETCL
jgi:hypothetical protein